jgi:hypothetical protein
VRAHGKKRKEVETDVTSFWYFQHCGYVVTWKLPRCVSLWFFRQILILTHSQLPFPHLSHRWYDMVQAHVDDLMLGIHLVIESRGFCTWSVILSHEGCEEAVMQISHLPGRAEEQCRLSITMADLELRAIV